jgi:type I site-specific restriction endonuclease
VFDFWDNFEYWDMHPEGDQKESGEAITNWIFLTRLRQFEHCLNAGEMETAEGVKKKLLEDIASLPKDSVKVYKEKVEDRIKRLADEHPAIMKIKNAFNTYIIENIRHYSADQLNFIRTVQTVFSKKKHIEYTELFDAPFTNFGINAPMPMFTENELNDFINICSVLEKEIYAEA